MAGGVTINVDARAALIKFSPSGIPESVRRNLRTMLPDLTKRLGALVDSKLDSGLKTRRRLQTKKEIVESPTALYGRVSVVSTSEPKLLPLWLDQGTKPHEIAAKNASALFFFWDKMGMNVAFRRVMHPGFAGIHFMQESFDEMRGEIVSGLTAAIKKGAAEVSL